MTVEETSCDGADASERCERRVAEIPVLALGTSSLSWPAAAVGPAAAVSGERRRQVKSSSGFQSLSSSLVG
jgi:hypothetical protein